MAQIRAEPNGCSDWEHITTNKYRPSQKLVSRTENVLHHQDATPRKDLLSGVASSNVDEESFHTDPEIAKQTKFALKPNGLDHKPSRSDIARSFITFRAQNSIAEAEMTGALPFMAVQLVKAMEDGIQIEHRVQHDMESFKWVLSYAVIRLLLDSASDLRSEARQAISLFFRNAWGESYFFNVSDAKAVRRAINPSWSAERFMPPPVLSLLKSLHLLVLRQEVAVQSKEPTILDHGALLEAIVECLAAFDALDPGTSKNPDTD